MIKETFLPIITVILMCLNALFCGDFQAIAQGVSADATYQVAVLQYRGGGDWYSNPTSLPNLVEFCNSELNMNIDETVPYVEVSSSDLSMYPFIHMTGHGNVVFSSSEVRFVTIEPISKP